jgi:carbon-monoxide dehydrogenase medium subunit
MIPVSFDYVTPKSLNEAIRALADGGDDAKILAGGHSLLPLMKLRLANPTLLIDVSKIAGLNGVKQQGDKIVIGALATHYQIESSELLKKRCPLLCQTARVIGDVQVRNRGTIGGSLVHGDPAGDWPAAILALGGQLKISGAKGERWLDVEKFFLGPMTTAIEANEILTEIHLPAAPRRSGCAYLKMPQQASGFAIVGVAVSLRLDTKGRCEDIGIGVTGLSDKPFRARMVEDWLRGRKLSAKSIEAAAALVVEDVEPLEDLHAAADYRAQLAQVFTGRAIQEASRRVGH